MEEEIRINKQEKEILEKEANKQFELEFLVMPKALYKLDVNTTELKILCFIVTYSSEKFYFTNKQLSEMMGVSERSISSAINSLKEMGFINITYQIKAGGGKIRFISKTEQLEEFLSSNRKNSYHPTGRNLLIKDNKIKDNKIKDITPLPPLKGGDVQVVDNSVDNVDKSEKENNSNNKQDNSNFNLNEQKWASSEILGAGAYGTQGAGEKTLKNENKASDKVNWDNCRNDNQRLMAFWVQLEHPELYKNATKEQAQEFFKRFTRDSSSILKMAGDLEIAKEAVKACREWLRSKKLEYNLTTIARNIGKFIDETIRKYQLPPETDLTLLDEYKKLYKELKDQDISQIEIVKAIKQKMKETGKNINEILEEAVRKLKQKISSEIANSEIGDVIRKVAEKVSINQEVK